MASVEGWLFKLGGGASEGGSKSSRWNKRYFVLRGHLLCYYAKEEGARGVAWQTPSGVVRADKVMLHDEWGDDASDDNHAKWQFALAHPDGDNLVLAAMTRPEREKWVAALEACGSGPQRAAAAKAQAELEAAQAAAKEARAAAKAERPAPAAADADAEYIASREAELAEAQRAAEASEAAAAAAEAELAAAEARADAELQRAKERLSRRRALLHWRYTRLRKEGKIKTGSFDQLIDPNAAPAAPEQGAVSLTLEYPRFVARVKEGVERLAVANRARELHAERGR